MCKCRGRNIYIFKMHLLNEEQEPSFLKFKTHPLHIHQDHQSTNTLCITICMERHFSFTYTLGLEIHTERAVRVKKNVHGSLIVCVQIQLSFLRLTHQYNFNPQLSSRPSLSFVPQSVVSIYFSYESSIYTSNKYEPFYKRYIDSDVSLSHFPSLLVLMI